MVEALVALRDHEKASYENSTSKATAVEFMRAAREIGILLRELTARSACNGGQHRPAPSRPRPVVDERDWLEAIGADEAFRNAQRL
jgi:hypothetical protein